MGQFRHKKDREQSRKNEREALCGLFHVRLEPTTRNPLADVANAVAKAHEGDSAGNNCNEDDPEKVASIREGGRKDGVCRRGAKHILVELK